MKTKLSDMTTFELREVSHCDEAEKCQSEILTLADEEIEGTLIVYTGQQGDHTLSIIPSLNVSGYGIDEEDSVNALKENLETLFEDLFGISESERKDELSRMGWNPQPSSDQPLPWLHFEEKEILQNFDFPERVKTSILQAA
jgi:hypothetical protein